MGYFDALPTRVKIGLIVTGLLILWPFIQRQLGGG